MFVALADERPSAAATTVPDPAAAELVARLLHYREALGPHQRDTDMGFLIATLTAVAYEDFEQSVSA